MHIKKHGQHHFAYYLSQAELPFAVGDRITFTSATTINEAGTIVAIYAECDADGSNVEPLMLKVQHGHNVFNARADDFTSRYFARLSYPSHD